MVAAEDGHEALVEALLESGAEISDNDRAYPDSRRGEEDVVSGNLRSRGGSARDHEPGTNADSRRGRRSRRS
jgi:hypothetical protein